VNLNMVIDILRLDREQQRTEPLKRAEIPANPEEVHFPQARAALRVVHAVPDALEDGRERRDSNTGTDEDSDFELEHVLGGGAKGAIDVDTGQDLAECNLLAAVALLALFAGRLLVDVAAERFADGTGEVADHAHVDRDVVFLGCAGEREGVVLPN
jgi:hypothetical protein